VARTGTIARRYAEAAFQLAERDGNVEQWLEQLNAIGDALRDPAVVRRLEDPQVALAERQATVIDSLGKNAIVQVRNLVGLVVRRGRLDAMPDIAREFGRLYNRREGIVEATATSAMELDEREVAALRARLEQFTSGKVQLDLKVDPSLLGGVQVRLGDLLIDGSVRGRLERLRGRLASGALTT
jgi:F-type H+-transporting ATPase subunit delta